MADDPYKALGVAKTASQDDIKKAYRKIAKTDHPDLNPDPAAAERFKAASSAYDLLKEPDQRARAGVFLAFQFFDPIPDLRGVINLHFLFLLFNLNLIRNKNRNNSC